MLALGQGQGSASSPRGRATGRGASAAGSRVRARGARADPLPAAPLADEGPLLPAPQRRTARGPPLGSHSVRPATREPGHEPGPAQGAPPETETETAEAPDPGPGQGHWAWRGPGRGWQGQQDHRTSLPSEKPVRKKGRICVASRWALTGSSPHLAAAQPPTLLARAFRPVATPAQATSLASSLSHEFKSPPLPAHLKARPGQRVTL